MHVEKSDDTVDINLEDVLHSGDPKVIRNKITSEFMGGLERKINLLSSKLEEAGGARLCDDDINLLIKMDRNIREMAGLHHILSPGLRKRARKMVKKLAVIKSKIKPIADVPGASVSKQFSDIHNHINMTEVLAFMIEHETFTVDKYIHWFRVNSGELTKKQADGWFNICRLLTGDVQKDLETVRNMDPGLLEAVADGPLPCADVEMFTKEFEDVIVGQINKRIESGDGRIDVLANHFLGDKPDSFLGGKYLENDYGNQIAWATRDNIEDAKKIPLTKLFADCQKASPDVWRIFTPRVYKGVDGWEDYRHFATYATSASEYCHLNPREMVLERDGRFSSSPSGMAERLVIAAQCAEHDIPTFFVGEDMLRAAMMTEPPSLIDWSDMKLPHEGAVFVLPKNSFISSRGGSIGFIAFARARAEKLLSVPHYGERFRVPVDILISVGLDHQGFFDYTRILVDAYQADRSGVETAKKIRIAGEIVDNPMYKGVQGSDMLGVKRQSTDKVKWEPRDIETTDKVMRVLMNLLMLMEAQPDLMDKPGKSEHRKVGHHKKTRQELWTPNILGRRYKIIRQPFDSENKGEHASPRWHWRRGHWREQGSGSLTCYCGHGRSAHDKETKRCRYNECLQVCDGAIYTHDFHVRTWIEPMLVNFKEESDAE